MEQLNYSRSLEEIMNDISLVAPLMVDTMEPSDAGDQKQAFLDGAIDQPDHDYVAMRSLNFDDIDSCLAELGEELARSADMNPKFTATYRNYVVHKRKINRMLQCAAIVNGDGSDADKSVATAEYVRWNEELFGTIDHGTYIAILASRLKSIEVDPADQNAQRLYDELKALVPAEALEYSGDTFRPDDQTFQTVRLTAQALYGNLIRHAPDRDESYSPDETKQILQDIIDQEFGDSAIGWKVVFVDNGGLRVVAGKKEVHLNRNVSFGASKLRGRIVHELGVHLLSAVRGSETDLLPLEFGLADYEASEEGKGMVMQQAIEGKYVLAGAGHYITAGYMQAGHSFRDTFDLKWRLQALQTYRPGSDISEKAIDKAKDLAYGMVMRIARGTDSLPFLKDLSYYNGTKEMWEFFERHAGDELMLNLMLLGKLNPNNDIDMRSALETHSR